MKLITWTKEKIFFPKEGTCLVKIFRKMYLFLVCRMGIWLIYYFFSWPHFPSSLNCVLV